MNKPKPKSGRCCACGYEGDDEVCKVTDCKDIHCWHWWEGPDSADGLDDETRPVDSKPGLDPDTEARR